MLFQMTSLGLGVKYQNALCSDYTSSIVIYMIWSYETQS
jgi:hypothetical protein